ncbi:hypothetical protein BDZ89DRAFT_1044684 [Hymenopellis radicata]|nr:hypothetical protein BDZ89DRAFT_1044684 [Hymenopellis radicata]
MLSYYSVMVIETIVGPIYHAESSSAASDATFDNYAPSNGYYFIHVDVMLMALRTTELERARRNDIFRPPSTTVSLKSRDMMNVEPFLMKIVIGPQELAADYTPSGEAEMKPGFWEIFLRTVQHGSYLKAKGLRKGGFELRTSIWQQRTHTTPASPPEGSVGPVVSFNHKQCGAAVGFCSDGPWKRTPWGGDCWLAIKRSGRRQSESRNVIGKELP